MWEVELDIFSGMPNPRWLLTRAEESDLRDQVSAQPGHLTEVTMADEEFSLGYRGLIVRKIKPDEGTTEPGRLSTGEPLPDEFRVGSIPRSEPIAAWLLETSGSHRKGTRVTDDLRELAAGGVALVSSSLESPQPATFDGETITEHEGDDTSRFPVLDGEGADSPGGPSGAVGEAITGATWYACPSNYFSANAATFNASQHVTRNNCYCFASNHLAGVRYALPGRRGGRPATQITCGGGDTRTVCGRMEERMPDERPHHCSRDLAGSGLPLLPTGHRGSELVVGPQAGRYTREVHRRLRERHLPVQRAGIRPEQLLPGAVHRFLRVLLPEQRHGIRGLT